MQGFLSFISSFPTLLHSGVVFGTVIMYGALGEILTQKSGNLNLGVPGVMYLGGIAGLAASFMYENVYCPANGITASAFVSVTLSLVACFLAAALGSLMILLQAK